MARDAELDRLHAAQQRAFERKQEAYRVQQSAWERRSAVRDTMNRAYENASSAYERRDGAGASSYAADDGRRYKEEAQNYVAERRRLVEEIRVARVQLDAHKPGFQRAKEDFAAARQAFQAAKAAHERAQADFKRAKAEFDAAAKAFQTRLDKVKTANQKRRDDKKSIAAKAGVPIQHRNNVVVSTDTDGNTNIYFGGVGASDGPGHGHYVLDGNGNVTYKRDPFDPHGGQNFQRNKEVVKRKLDRAATSPRRKQYHDGTITVKVKSGYHRDTDSIVTDFIIIDRATSREEHLHLGDRKSTRLNSSH